MHDKSVLMKIIPIIMVSIGVLTFDITINIVGIMIKKFFCLFKLTLSWALQHHSLTSQSMCYKTFKDVWKSLTLGWRPNWKTSDLTQREGWSGIHWNGWEGIDFSHLSAKKKKRKKLSHNLWSSWCIGQRRFWNHSTEALMVVVSPKPSSVQKQLIMSAVCLLGYMGWG